VIRFLTENPLIKYMAFLYTPPDRNFLKNRLGTDSELLANEFAKLGAFLDDAKIKTFDLTGSMISGTSLAASGVDIADGTNPTYPALFCADVPMTIVGMVTVMTEVYAKDTTDAKIEIKDNAGSPVTKCSITLPSAGRAAKTFVTTTPINATLAIGDILNLAITSTGASGTGHAKVLLKYIID
jgi:hypothetical protein